MRFIFLILFILNVHSSFSQESNIDRIVGVWTVKDAGITYFALCGNFDSSKSIGTRIEFLNSGQVNFYKKKEDLDQSYITLQWKFTNQNTMIIKSENGEIDLGKLKFGFYDNKLRLDNNVHGLWLEKNNL